MDKAQNIDEARGSASPVDTQASPRRRRARANVRRRVNGAARRWLWAILTFLMLVVGSVAACQSPNWLGPSHHEPALEPTV